MSSDRRFRRPIEERGSALMLAPALVLVLAVLGGLAVDTAVAHSTQRDLYRTLSAAADDAAGMLDQHRLQADGTVTLDEAAAERVALAHLGVLRGSLGAGADGADAPRRLVSSQVTVDERTITITAVVEVEHVFLSAVPGMADSSTVQVTTVGRLIP